MMASLACVCAYKQDFHVTKYKRTFARIECMGKDKKKQYQNAMDGY